MAVVTHNRHTVFFLISSVSLNNADGWSDHVASRVAITDE
jgi:hypothetical protein